MKKKLRVWVLGGIVAVSSFGERARVSSRDANWTAEYQAYLSENPQDKKFVEYWQKQNPDATITQLAFAIAVRKAGGFSVYGAMSPGVCKAASAHARSISATGQGHLAGPVFENQALAAARTEKLGVTLTRAAELEAETFSVSSSLMENAKQCARMWADSYGPEGPSRTAHFQSGHWKKVYAVSRAFCYDFVCLRRNVCSCSGILVYGPEGEPREKFPTYKKAPSLADPPVIPWIAGRAQPQNKQVSVPHKAQDGKAPTPAQTH